MPSSRVARERNRRWHRGIITLALIMGFAGLLVPAAPPALASDLSFTSRRIFGGGADNTQSVVSGDINGDGALDLVIGNSDQQSAVYLNQGGGYFATDLLDCAQTERVRCFGASAPISSVALGDINADGALDIAVARPGQQSAIYLNDGSGTFATGPLDCAQTERVRCFGAADPTSSLELGDVNGDGKLDIAAGHNGSQSVIYLNNGAGAFATGAVACDLAQNMICFGGPADPTTSVVLGDINGDGRLDLVAGNTGQPDVFYLNSGGTQLLPQAPPCNFLSDAQKARVFGCSAKRTTSLALGDLDRDGHFDLIAGRDDANSPLALYIYKQILGFNVFVSPFDVPNASETGVALIATRSVAFGDVDGDGDLDVAIANDGPNIALLNDWQDNPTRPAYALPVFGNTGRSVALADVDADGDLDLVVGTHGQNVIYINNDPGRRAKTGPFVRAFAGASNSEKSAAVGDMNGDGRLDLIVGRNGEQSAVYLNRGADQLPNDLPNCAATAEVLCFGGPADPTTSIAVADLNGDGRLDIVAGNTRQQSAVYLNGGASGFATGAPDCAAADRVRCIGGPADLTTSVVTGDIDNDGDLDIVAGSAAHTITVYANTGAGVFPDPITFSAPQAATKHVTLGDLDGDGDLDLVTDGLLFINNGVGSFAERRLFGPNTSAAVPVALGDLNADERPDIIAGSYAYLNDGAGNFFQGFPVCDVTPNVRCLAVAPTSVVTGDVNGDGATDIVVGSAQQDVLYLNDGHGQFTSNSVICGFTAEAHCFGSGSDPTTAVALGDIDGDGLLDIVAVNKGQPSSIYLNGLGHALQPASTLPTVRLARPGLTADANFFSTPLIISGSTISITYTLTDPNSIPAREVRAFYSLDGGGHWRLAKPAVGSQTTNVGTSPTGAAHVFPWDILASGFFGQSDAVVFRMEVYPGLGPQANTIAGPYQRPFATTQTFPFRARGTQVRVRKPDPQQPGASVPAQDALVYRLSSGATAAEAFPSGDRSFTTDAQGYLQGRGTLAISDTLFALVPITTTADYVVYYTNIVPQEQGAAGYTVATPGVQTITVSPDHPFVLFNLDISLEWDARSDPSFLGQLEYDLQRTSELLFDWTNGQAALGQIHVYQNREHWDDAHVRIYANNRMRPNAVQGGITRIPLVEPARPSFSYTTGQVRIGATWNRYGDPNGTLGEDWPRALAHEIGHYALFLDDNYLALSPSGQIIPTDQCPGAMSDPYRDDYSEFHSDVGWLEQCAQTLSEQQTHRSDWATIAHFYPPLKGIPPNSGPSQLPLKVTRVQVVAPQASALPLATPIFLLRDTLQQRVVPGASARAFLFQGDRLIDLGRPTLDQIQARGARPGDRLCIYEPDQRRQGCVGISTGNQPLEMRDTGADWPPQIQVTPITSRTLQIDVSFASGVPANLALQAQLFPVSDAPPTAPITLTPTLIGYTGVFTPAVPAFEGYVHVQDTSSTPHREIVTDYLLGGNPGSAWGRNAPRGNPGSAWGRNAPVLSGDGHAIVYGADLHFDEGQFFALQATTALPSPLAWTTAVGPGYWLTTSAHAPDLSHASISIGYLGNEVAPGEERWIQMYFWNGTGWRVLPTKLDTYHNEAVASVQGPGLYVLMSSIAIPLTGPGWNLIDYPVSRQLPVAQALRSIDGKYKIVYSYVPTDTLDQWKVYGVGVPDWVDDLRTLQFGHGYWINATDTITLYLKGGDTQGATPTRLNPSPARNAALAANTPSPPATFYSVLHASADFTPTVGMAVLARVNGEICGQTTTRLEDGQVVFAIDVLADGAPNTAGCGLQARPVMIQVGSRSFTAAWDNSQVWELPDQPLGAPQLTVMHPARTRRNTR